jgi:hypothetical protein
MKQHRLSRKYNNKSRVSAPLILQNVKGAPFERYLTSIRIKALTDNKIFRA